MDAIRQIIDGGRYVERELAADLAANALVQGYPFRDLSVRELDILRLLAQGKSMSEISAALSISYKTVANICTSLKQKLMAERTGDLIRIAVEMHST